MTSKFAKKANTIKKLFFKASIWVPKNAEIYADFESVEKIARNACEKSFKLKSDRKI